MYRRVTNVYRKPPIRSGGGLNQGKPQVLTYQNSRTQILAELSNLANPGPVQRDVTVTVAAGNINTVTVNRANVQTFFNGARQGDHTTAFVVYAAMFHNRLNGQTLVAARAVLNNIRAEILALPGYVNLAAAPAWAQAITNTELAAVTAARAAAIAAGAGVTLAQINAYASALLSFRNVIPLSAIEFGSVGHGEGHHNAQLQLLNNQLAAGNPLNAARRASLQTHVLGLVDSNTVSQHNALPLGAADADIMPGMLTAGAASIPANQTNVAAQHLQSIESAFPAIAAALAAAPAVRVNLQNHIQQQL